jgi:hypothetical protein
MNKDNRKRFYRIVLSDGVTTTEVSRKLFEAHLAAHRIVAYKHDTRKAATVKGWISFIDHREGIVVFQSRSETSLICIVSNFRSILQHLIFRPPFDEWAMQQHDQVYGQAAA